MICRWDRGLASEVECFAPRLRKPDSAPSLSSILIPPCVIPIPPLTPNPATQHLPAPPSRSPPKHAPTRTLTSHPTPSHPSLTHRPSPSNPPSPSRPSQPHPLCVYTHTVPYRTHQTRTQRMLCLTEYQYQYQEKGIRRKREGEGALCEPRGCALLRGG